MKLFKIINLSIALFFSIASLVNPNKEDKVRILLIGDSTTIGGKGVFETTIEDIINKNVETPSVEVINSARGGETALSVVESGRYNDEIKPLGKFDYIFVRYGINDYFKRKPIEENFPKDYKKLIKKLKVDFPTAKIVLTTIIPFLDESSSTLVNNMVKELASKNNLEFFDIYPSYKKALEVHGENAMSVRFVPLSNIPNDYKNVALPYSSFVQWKNTEMVRMLTPELDPILGDVEDWYKDKHPNPMGYRLLAIETVNYLLPILKKNPKALPLSQGVKEEQGEQGVLVDKLYQVDAPTKIKVGETINVKVSYSATEKRNLAVFIQLNKSPWTAVSASVQKIEKGKGEKVFSIAIPKDVELGSDYKIAVNILPLGKGWPDRLDEKIKNRVSITK